jgi:hypothetical protein
MHIEAIFCPACRHKLRIPEDLLGTEVQCPECKAQFVAPPPPPGAAAAPNAVRERLPPPSPHDERGDEYIRQDEPRADAGRKVIPPAVGVFLAAGAHLLMNGMAVVQAIFAPEQLQQAAQQMRNMFPAAPQMDIARLSLIGGILFIGVSVVQALCGLAMLTRRSYALSLVGAALCVANCNQVCCLLSIPVGIWALVVLMTPDVRASFPR